MPGYSLELETIKRIGKLLKAYEGGGFSPRLDLDNTGGNQNHGMAVRVVQVTGAKQSDGTFPAKLIGRNSEAYNATWSDYETVSVVDLNDQSLVSGKRYLALCVGWYEGSGSGSGGSTGSAAGLWVVFTAEDEISTSVVTNVTCSGSTLVVTKATISIPGGTVT